MAEVTGVKVNELPKKTAYDENDLLYVVSNGIDLKMEMGDLKHNVAPNVFRGATELTPGESGLVPTPTVTDSNKVLGGDGEWKELAPVAISGDFNDLENKPEITEIEANPSGEATEELSKLKVDTTIYKILAAKVHGEATGDLITIEDAMEAPLEECKVTLEPQQDLNGYEYPWAGGAGKNKLPLSVSEIKSSNGGANSWTNNSKEISGIVYTILTDSDENVIGIKANGTATANSILYLMSTTAPPIQLDGQSVIISMAGFSKGAYKDNSWHDILAPSTESTVTLNGDVVQMWGQINNGVQVNNIVIQPMIRLASVADSTFAPYSNICPISGWSAVNRYRTGINVWDEEWEVGSISDASGQDATNSNYRRSKSYISVKANKKYYFNVPSKYGTTYRFYQYKQNKDYIGIKTVDSDGTFETDNDCAFIRFRIATTEDYTNDISINYPSTDTSYHAYNGHTTTIDLNGTRYGGKVDVVNGTMTVDRASVDMGDLYWNYGSSSKVFTASVSGIKSGTYTDENLISSIYPVTPLPYSQFEYGLRYDSPTSIGVKNPLYTDATAFKTAMSGVQLVYELATPQEIQLTPTEVTLLRGINNLWSDGEMYIKYRRDLDIFLNKLEARVRALEEG